MTARTETDVIIFARALAQAHDVATLAAALVARLRKEGRAESAAAVAAMFSGERHAQGDGAVNPNPPDPHYSEVSSK